jgi:hypothetical protein
MDKLAIAFLELSPSKTILTIGQCPIETDDGKRSRLAAAIA